MMYNLEVQFSNLLFKNPVLAASGTFGFGQEYKDIYDISTLGGICTKGLTISKKSGNDGLRVWETPMGMMNSVGLENPGIDTFLRQEYPKMKEMNTRMIVNVGGSTEDEYLAIVDKLNHYDIDMVELNISCPNVKEGCMAFGLNESHAGHLVKSVRNICKHLLVVKLSPNAENVVGVAEACEKAGADGISLINTIKALAIDVTSRKPVFDNVYAGLSGPAIKPIALRMTHEVCKAVHIPVIGMGGIMTWKDAVEFIMAGAHLIQIGTANFINPEAGKEIILGLQNYMEQEGLKSLDEIRGII